MQLDHGERRSSSSSSRLPVNPRRHKVAPEQRKRVATACNNCNVRRIKCSGERPCSQCASSSRECVYPAPVEKVSVPRSELDELRKKAEMLEKALQDALPDPTRRQELLRQLAAEASPDSSPSPSPFASGQSLPPTSQQSPMSNSIKTEPTTDDDSNFVSPSLGRPLRDPQGISRFLGETSGSMFLDQIKQVLAAVLPPVPTSDDEPMSSVGDGRGFMASLGRYETNDADPLRERDVDPLWLPSRNTVGAMLAALRHLIQDGNGEWASGGIYWWGELGSIPSPASASPSHESDLNKFRHLAFYHTALAIASHSRSPTRTPASPDSDAPPNPSEDFFARAVLLLGNPLDMTRCTIGDVAVLALMGYYLIEVHRRDAASMYVSAAINISIMLGAHRGWVDERGRRVFWTVYILDRWLSCLSGRPPTLADDAIRLPLPADAPSMPPAAGLRAHVELSRISGQIVDDMYHSAAGDASRSPERALWTLQRWQASLPVRLHLTPDGLSNDPAACMLHMRCNQLLVVATRPLLLQAVNRSVRARFSVQSSAAAEESSQTQLVHLKSCMSAARRNIRLGRHLVSLNGNRRMLHGGLHFIFNAAVCLILQDLVRAQDSMSAQDVAACNKDVDFVIDRLDREAQREADVLRDIRVLIGRIASMPASTDLIASSSTAESSSSPQGNIDPMLFDEMVPWIDEDWPMYNIYMES